MLRPYTGAERARAVEHRGIELAVTISALTLVGCSKAAALGCLTGVASATGLGLTAAATAGDESEEELDTGAALLGSALFGLVAGCSAAGVAAAVAVGDNRTAARVPRGIAPRQSPYYDDGHSASTPAPRRRDRVSSSALLDGLKVTWLGAPASRMTRPMTLFESHLPGVDLSKCNEAVVEADSRVMKFPITHDARPPSTTIAKIESGIDELRTMKTAQRVTFDLCGLRRELHPSAASALRLFFVRFAMLAERAGPARPEAVPPAAVVPVRKSGVPASAAVPAQAKQRADGPPSVAKQPAAAEDTARPPQATSQAPTPTEAPAPPAAAEASGAGAKGRRQAVSDE
ncbi:MAG: hypothetical protein OXU20_16965 [Myxococcales bacterium]|nr:hypothetical protein [Myxococcales bacterium]